MVTAAMVEGEYTDPSRADHRKLPAESIEGSGGVAPCLRHNHEATIRPWSDLVKAYILGSQALQVRGSL